MFNYKQLMQYQKIECQHETKPLLHLKSGVFLTNDDQNNLSFYIPGKGFETNYLGVLQEDEKVTDAVLVFESKETTQLKNELQILYSTGLHLKMLSLKDLNSSNIYKNLNDITCLSLVS